MKISTLRALVQQTVPVVLGLLRVCMTALVMVSVSWANDVQVSCAGGDPGGYPSINDALNTLDQQGYHSITVTGVCTENVTLDHRERLVIQAPEGQTATIVAADPAGIVLHSFGSHGILLNRLVLQGGSTGLLVNQKSEVALFNSVVQQNSGGGIVAQVGSTLQLENTTVQNNQGTGVAVSGNSDVTFATYPDQRIRIQGNTGNGIELDDAYMQVNFGTLSVEKNGWAAIIARGTRLVVFGSPTENLFQNNGEGIDIFNGSSASFYGLNTIRGNGEVGLQVLASSVEFLGQQSEITLIEGHSGLGVNVVRLGELTFSGQHKIRNNGSFQVTSEFRGGIRVNRGALTLNGNPEISGNTGLGIRVAVNSSVILGAAAITNNSEGGVRVTRQSLTGFNVSPAMFGNGGSSIACDSTSLVFGDLSSVGGIDCSRVERSEGPARRGKIQD